MPKVGVANPTSSGEACRGAFTSVFAPFTAIELDEYKRVTEVTYLG